MPAEALERHPIEPMIAYNLACAEARLGSVDPALDHLERAIAVWPEMAVWARDEEDFASLAAAARFTSIVAGSDDE